MKIQLENISKSFDNNIVLNNVNIEFESGKIYGIIGRNGSGKSVLLKVLCGLYVADKGNIYIDGKLINLKKEFLPDTRVLIDKPSFLPDKTGFENLKLLACIQNKITDNEINMSLDLVNLSNEERSKKFYKYSLGMKQKLGFAQVIMENPSIMIFDEPFNGLEESTVDKLRDYLLKEKNNDKIIIIATHISDDINMLSDITYKIDNGNIFIN